jgi:hypothetical protein
MTGFAVKPSKERTAATETLALLRVRATLRIDSDPSSKRVMTYRRMD